MLRSILVVFFCTIQLTGTAASITLPPTVVTEIKEMEDSCRDRPNGLIKTDLSAIKILDITGDGLSDYIIDDSTIACESGLASFHHGNGGVGIVIFAGTKNGALKVFDRTVLGIDIKPSKSPRVVWIKVGGAYCGKFSLKRKIDAITCERSLIWNKKRKKLVFTPLSQAVFSNKNHNSHP